MLDNFTICRPITSGIKTNKDPSVFEVSYKASGFKYALKKLPMRGNQSCFEFERRARLQINALKQIRHENVIVVLDVGHGSVDPSNIYLKSNKGKKMLQENHEFSQLNMRANHCNMYAYFISPIYDITLEKWIAQSGPSHNEHVISSILEGLCNGVCAIHAAGMRHNNLDPSNILLRFEERKERNSKSLSATDSSYKRKIIPCPVICDFACVSPVKVEVMSRLQASELLDFYSKNTNPAYRAPEVWKIRKMIPRIRKQNNVITRKGQKSNSTQSQEYTIVSKSKNRLAKPAKCTVDCRADVFSLGCCMYYILFGSHAFEKTINFDKIPNRWVAPIQQELLDMVPRHLLHISLGMMLEIPELRLDIMEILTEVLPQGRLGESINLAIFERYSLAECDGPAFTPSVPIGFVANPRNKLKVSYNQTKRVLPIKSFAKGGTLSVKNLSTVDEDDEYIVSKETLNKINRENFPDMGSERNTNTSRFKTHEINPQEQCITSTDKNFSDNIAQDPLDLLLLRRDAWSLKNESNSQSTNTSSGALLEDDFGLSLDMSTVSRGSDLSEDASCLSPSSVTPLNYRSNSSADIICSSVSNLRQSPSRPSSYGQKRLDSQKKLISSVGSGLAKMRKALSPYKSKLSGYQRTDDDECLLQSDIVLDGVLLQKFTTRNKIVYMKVHMEILSDGKINVRKDEENSTSRHVSYDIDLENISLDSVKFWGPIPDQGFLFSISFSEDDGCESERINKISLDFISKTETEAQLWMESITKAWNEAQNYNKN